MAAKTRTRTTPRGFYAAALSDAERASLTTALAVEGIDEEIAVLRLRLRSALAERPEDLPLMFKGIDLLAKTVATRYRLSKHEEKEVGNALAAAFREMDRVMSEETANA